MACSNCGMPADGRLCEDCRREEHLEDYYGVTGDDSPDVRDWEGDDDD